MLKQNLAETSTGNLDSRFQITPKIYTSDIRYSDVRYAMWRAGSRRSVAQTHRFDGVEIPDGCVLYDWKSIRAYARAAGVNERTVRRELEENRQLFGVWKRDRLLFITRSVTRLITDSMTPEPLSWNRGYMAVDVLPDVVLKPGTARLWDALHWHDKEDKPGIITASQETLAQYAACSVRSIYRRTRELEEKGLIEVFHGRTTCSIVRHRVRP